MLLIVALAMTVACTTDDNESNRSRTAVTIDTVGSIVLVENHGVEGVDPDTGALAHRDTIDARPVALIGQIDGAAEQTFGLVSSIAVDRDGMLYVSDAMAEDVRVFSPEARFLRRIGRRGDGPGEFRAPTGLTFDESGNLYVRDESRVQRFARTTDDAGIRYVGSYQGPPYAYLLEGSRVDRDGRFYYPRLDWREAQRFLYLVMDSVGGTIDTLRIPDSVQLPSPAAFLRTGRSGGRMVPGLSQAPFAPIPSWEVTREGTLLVTSGERYEIVEITATGDTVRVIRRTVPQRAVPQGEHRDSVRAVRDRVGALAAPLDRLEGVAPEIVSGEFPKMLPQSVGLQLGTDGRIWVQRWPSEGFRGSEYDVFTREGVFERTVRVPARLSRLPSPVFSKSRIYGVVVDPETEVQRIAIFELGSQ